jgi:hypothetical protein
MSLRIDKTSFTSIGVIGVIGVTEIADVSAVLTSPQMIVNSCVGALTCYV